MCYIIAVKKLNNDGKAEPRIEAHIKQIVADKMNYNADGAFIRCGNDQLKTLDYKKAKEFLADSEVNNLIVHLRQATIGYKSQNNIHGYTRGANNRWQFLHNGGITQGVSRSSRKSDSLQWFEQLVSIINSAKMEHSEDIADLINALSSGFWGRGFLIDQKLDRVFVFGKSWHIYIVNEMYLIISSADIHLESITSSRDYHGIKFYSEKPSDLEVLHKELDGLAVIEKYHTSEFKYNWLDAWIETIDYSVHTSDTPVLDRVSAQVSASERVPLNLPMKQIKGLGYI